MMEHESCRHLLGSLSEYVDGDLGDELCAEIDRHLQDCNNCRVVIDTLRKTINLYHDLAPSPSVPDDVRQRLYHSLDLDEFLEKKA
jgi:predicted anti-sigma-YlaC factor YlaD